ncbi:thioesterase family protein [Nocardioides sp. BP30]|uniref:thioesterase family protein n=1 Tax=Nocardioides sp. BP30 TaxID=3036374 RepID=UPI0024694C31|nr:thioesterase family protein [Nocardioides sp. BP30]WGL53454.1 thioesterase family protein [Nocardioides sp. BP30]
MGAAFDRDICVNAVSQRPGGGGEFSAELSGGWIVGGGVNGGYLLATLGNAVRSTVPAKPDPFTISAYYLSASVPGPATITTRILRDGGSVATVAAELVQDGTARITALATYGDLAALPEEHRTTATPPDLPPREQCVPNTMAPEQVRTMAPMMERFEMLFHPDHIGWAVGEPSGRGVISAWFRLEDGREPDPLSLLTVVDLLPPVTFDLGRPGWAPTLELTVHVRALPAPGWLQVRHATRNVAGGMFEEDCEVWDSAGRLVAQSRQLARLPR